MPLIARDYTADCPGKSVPHSFLLFDPPYVSYLKKKKKKVMQMLSLFCGFVGFFVLAVNIPAPHYAKGGFLLYGSKIVPYVVFFF